MLQKTFKKSYENNYNLTALLLKNCEKLTTTISKTFKKFITLDFYKSKVKKHYKIIATVKTVTVVKKLKLNLLFITRQSYIF